MTRSLPHALVGLILAALAALSAPEPLRAVTVFEDHDLSTWTFLSDPGDPGIQLVHLPYGNPYLFVRQRHIAGGYSRKQSDQGAPAAIYRPQSSGAVAGFTFSGRFRPHFEGEPLASYSSAVVRVLPLLRQAGRVYVADAALYEWTRELPLAIWTSFTSAELPATRFLLNGLTPERPDFSASAAPIELGLRVVTSFQRGAIEPTEQTFEVDIDDFRVEGTADDSTSPPRLFFTGTSAIYESEAGPVAIYTTPRDQIDDPIVSLPVALSRSLPVDLIVGVRDIAGTQMQFAEILPAGRTGETLAFEVTQAEQVVRLATATGDVILGAPSLAAILSRPATTVLCATEMFERWFAYLACRLGQEPQFCSLLPYDGSLEGSEDPPSMVTTLRRLRDEIMVQSAAGRRYRAMYEGFDGALQDAMLASPLLIADLFRSAPAWVDALGALVDGEGGSTTISTTMAADLRRLLDEFAAVAAPPLARAISEERSRLGLDTIAGLTMTQFWDRVETRGEAGPCEPSPNRLCLGGGRWAVEADFETFDGTPGRARAVPLTSDSGYFWFFNAANVELLTKVVAGCGTNQRFWSYNAGLTNLAVDLWVHDPESGQGKLYRSGAGENFEPILDSDFAQCEEGAAAPTASEIEPSRTESVTAAATACVPSESALCLLGGRFRATATYRTAAGATGSARAVPLTSDTGTFWFFSSSNIELVVKAIDACGLPGFHNHWIFAAGTTDVAVDLIVEDTVTGAIQRYQRPLGVPFAPVLDSGAFGGCP